MGSRAVTAGLLAAAVAAAATGCGDGAPGGGERVAVATTTQVGDLARNVAGDRKPVRPVLAPNP
ncbi:MAG: metal ABC transporter solute-binding protein, Zn/Mn family, partial [Thermoleophilaceae bacterium]